MHAWIGREGRREVEMCRMGRKEGCRLCFGSVILVGRSKERNGEKASSSRREQGEIVEETVFAAGRTALEEEEETVLRT